MKPMTVALLCAFLFPACQSASTPERSESDFFEPQSFGTSTTTQTNAEPAQQTTGAPAAQQAAEFTAEDFHYWVGDREVVLHPTSSDNNDPLFENWDMLPYHTVNAGDDVHRAAIERFQQTPGIFGGVRVPHEEQVSLAAEKGVSVDRLRQDLWISLGSPFDHDVVHIFQSPILPWEFEGDGVHRYETSDFVLVRHQRSMLDIVFAPDAVRRGETGVIPEAFRQLFEATAERGTYGRLKITYLYPSYRGAVEAERHIVGSSSHVRKLTILSDYSLEHLYDEVSIAPE